MAGAEVARRQYELYLASSERFLREVARVCDIGWTVSVRTLARYLSAVVDGATLAWIVDRDRRQSLAVFDQLAEHLATLAAARQS